MTAEGELSPRFHPAGGHFLVSDYPKGKKHCHLKVSVQLVAKLTAHAGEAARYGGKRAPRTRAARIETHRP